MNYNPTYIFEDENSIGILNVPLSSIVLIQRVGTNEEPLLVTKIANGTLTSNSTIRDFLADTNLYDRLIVDSELERINSRLVTEPAWRVLGRDASKYVQPGIESVDFSKSLDELNPRGAKGDFSFTEGVNTASNGRASHAEGYLTIAGGAYSHAEGYDTHAKGDYTHTGGWGTIARSMGATALGRWNKQSILDGDYLFEIGAGTTTDPKNAFEIDICNIMAGYEVRAPLTKREDILNWRTLTTKEYVDWEIDNLWLDDLVDVTAIPTPTNIENNPEKFNYKGNHYYRLGDVIRVVNGISTNIYRCIANPGYWSAGDLSANPQNLGGTFDDFIDEVNNWKLITTSEVAKQNHLLVYNPLVTGGNTNMETGRWENVEDLDFGYYYP